MFLYTSWRNTPINTRIKIAESFGLIKKKSTHVSDNKVIDDGYLIEDVESVINIDRLQQYTGSDSTDMVILWDLMIDKVEGKVVIQAEPIVVENVIELVESTVEPVSQEFEIVSVGVNEKPVKKQSKKKK